MQLIHKSRWQFLQSVQEVFEQIFQMKVVLPVTAKFRADSDRASLMELLRRQNMPKTLRSGKAWSCMAGLLQHQSDFGAGAYSLASGERRPSIHRLGGKFITTGNAHAGPLKNSHLYIFGLSGAALPSEHFELQGWNLYGDPKFGRGADLRAMKNLLQTHQRGSRAGRRPTRAWLCLDSCSGAECSSSRCSSQVLSSRLPCVHCPVMPDV